MEKVFAGINANFHAPERQWISWIAERAILTSNKSPVDQIYTIISQELLHGETKLTVQVILEIPSDFLRNS